MTNPSSEPSDKTDRIIKLELDIDPTRRISSAREHERAVAIFDLLDDNEFKLLKASGPIIFICALINVIFILTFEIRQTPY